MGLGEREGVVGMVGGGVKVVWPVKDGEEGGSSAKTERAELGREKIDLKKTIKQMRGKYLD